MYKETAVCRLARDFSLLQHTSAGEKVASVGLVGVMDAKRVEEGDESDRRLFLVAQFARRRCGRLDSCCVEHRSWADQPLAWRSRSS